MDKAVEISIIMGSKSDLKIMQYAADILKDFDIKYEKLIISAHRTVDKLYQFSKNASHRGIKVIIAGAGGAAHLPGMVSVISDIPVLGVPIPSKYLKGLDSLLSIVQMPGGVPTASFAIGEAGAKNAALFAINILSLNNILYKEKLANFRKEQQDSCEKDDLYI